MLSTDCDSDSDYLAEKIINNCLDERDEAVSSEKKLFQNSQEAPRHCQMNAKSMVETNNCN